MSYNIPRHWVALRGKTYPVRERLKEECDAMWNRETGFWYVDPVFLKAAEEIIEEGE